MVAVFALGLTDVAIAEPIPFHATYKANIKGVPFRVTGTRELTKVSDGKFLLVSSATAFLASVTEQTLFKLDADSGVVPIEYQYHKSGLGKNRDAVLTFDWEEMRVLNDARSRSWQMKVPTGTQDKLSYQLKMREDLSKARLNGNKWPEMTYQVADDGEMKQYTFRVIGEETIETPAGTFDTIKATRVRDDNQRTTHFWLAPAFDFLLIRFEQNEKDGDGFKLLLKEAIFNGKPLAGVMSGAEV
ncbi:MAG: DUF3108 domain-containing protein [Pseudomonadales bacterium]